jgi:hypothetical protein
MTISTVNNRFVVKNFIVKTICRHNANPHLFVFSLLRDPFSWKMGFCKLSASGRTSAVALRAMSLRLFLRDLLLKKSGGRSPSVSDVWNLHAHFSQPGEFYYKPCSRLVGPSASCSFSGGAGSPSTLACPPQEETRPAVAFHLYGLGRQKIRDMT